MRGRTEGKYIGYCGGVHTFFTLVCLISLLEKYFVIYVDHNGLLWQGGWRRWETGVPKVSWLISFKEKQRCLNWEVGRKEALEDDCYL